MGTRFYVHVEDVKCVLLNLARQGKAGEKYNIVGPREVANLEFAELSRRLRR